MSISCDHGGHQRSVVHVADADLKMSEIVQQRRTHLGAPLVQVQGPHPVVTCLSQVSREALGTEPLFHPWSIGHHG
jgi:hypothetical protein